MRSYKVEITKADQLEFFITGKDFVVTELTPDEAPDDLEYFNDYSKQYKVELYGRIVLYLAKGHAYKPNQIVAWYAATKCFHRSYGESFKEIIWVAMNDVWKYIGIEA